MSMEASVRHIEFFVPGIPRPGGSKTASVIYGRDGNPVLKNGRAIVVTREAGQYTAEWRVNVAFFAKQAYQDELLDGPLSLDVTFIMPRIKGHYGVSGLKASAPKYHTVAPDTTKLLRSTEDALTGIIWRDDARVAEQHGRKIYGDKPGAQIAITTLDNEPKHPAGEKVSLERLFA